MTAKVLITHPLVDGGLALLEPHYTLEEAGGLSQPEQLIAALEGVDALITLPSDPVTAAVLAAGERLKIVANHAVGYDNIDLEAARQRGIWVTNTPGVLTEATADLAWAALLALVRRVCEGDALTRRGGFTGWDPRLLLGMELAGKTLGIVGLGQIGRATARRAFGFGLRVVYAGRSASGPVDLGPGQAEQLPLEQLLAEADIVSLHTPLSPETHHLLDQRRLALLKPSAYLINTSRGPVIDERALVAQLQAGQLRGAALDVYEHEPALAPGLAELQNVLLLPHVGSATQETRLRMAQTAAKNVHAALQGQRPPNPVGG